MLTQTTLEYIPIGMRTIPKGQKILLIEFTTSSTLQVLLGFCCGISTIALFVLSYWNYQYLIWFFPLRLFVNFATYIYSNMLSRHDLCCHDNLGYCHRAIFICIVSILNEIVVDIILLYRILTGNDDDTYEDMDENEVLVDDVV